MQHDYIAQLEAELKIAQDRVAASVAAANFMETAEGKVIQDWINTRVSYLMESMTAKAPMGDRDYLAAHGGIRELKDFNVMLQSKASSGVSAAEEVRSVNEQLGSLREDAAPKA